MSAVLQVLPGICSAITVGTLIAAARTRAAYRRMREELSQEREQLVIATDIFRERWRVSEERVRELEARLESEPSEHELSSVYRSLGVSDPYEAERVKVFDSIMKDLTDLEEKE